MFIKKLAYLLFLALLPFSCFSAEETKDNASKTQIREFKSINTTEIKLSNGMTFCLRPSVLEADEVFFKLSALGGFASLPQEDFSSGELADKIAWESGMGGMSSDQVSVYLYENFLEFAPEITALSRVVDGEGNKKSIEAFLKCLKMLFTEQQFTDEGFQTAKMSAKSMITKLNNDNDCCYEAVFLAVNTQDFQALKPLTIEGLNKVNFNVAKEFFQRCFKNPAEFFCVITGNFEVKNVVKLIEKHIGVIPKTEQDSQLKKTFSVPFPPGITEAKFRLGNQSSCLTHITFPLQIDANEKNIHEIAFMCQIMEARLRRVITEKMNLSYGVDVSYEFPLYPFLNNPWVSIRYRCEKKIVKPLKETVLNELSRLVTEGASTEEVAAIKKLEEGSQSFWLKDDFYWVSMLTNYYLWGWNPEKIDYDNTLIYEISVPQVNNILKKAISLTNYSIVTAKQEK